METVSGKLFLRDVAVHNGHSMEPSRTRPTRGGVDVVEGTIRGLPA
jgi:hypothetical protein